MAAARKATDEPVEAPAPSEPAEPAPVELVSPWGTKMTVDASIADAFE